MDAARRSLRLPLALSAAAHVALVAVVALRRADPPPAMPPVYRVDLVAAPPGPRAAGQVTPVPVPPAQPAPTPPPRAAVDPSTMAPAPAKTTPVPPKRDPAPPTTPTPPVPKPATPVPPQPAGGGPTGGRGTDVANVRTEGIEFPFPGYLNNIVRQVTLCFDPPARSAALRADVAFQVGRDGSVSEVRMVTRSGSFAFDNEARGAIECASRNFGPLPAGFRDDVLPVVFSFDPSLLR